MAKRPANTGTWGKVGLYVVVVLLIAGAIGWLNACAPVEPPQAVTTYCPDLHAYWRETNGLD